MSGRSLEDEASGPGLAGSGAIAPDPAAGDCAWCIPVGERVYAIGDVHGRLDLLDALLTRIAEDMAGRVPTRVHVVLLGDIVDRGPDPAELVARCMALTGRSPRFVVLKGNHEATMAQALAGDLTAFAHWLRAGGDATLLSWGVGEQLILDGALPRLLREARARIAPPALDWIAALPLTYRVGDYLFVHAGIRPEVALAEQQETDLLWIRQGFLESEADHECVVVHGHTVTGAADIRRNRIGIDTGAYRTGILTALGLEGDRHWILSVNGPVPSSAPSPVDGIAGEEPCPPAADRNAWSDLLDIVGADAPPADQTAATRPPIIIRSVVLMTTFLLLLLAIALLVHRHDGAIS